MKSINKILLASIAVLIIVGLVFLNYALFIKKPSNPTNSKTEAQKEEDRMYQAISEGNLTYLRLQRMGILNSSILENTYVGTIIFLDKDGGTINNSAFNSSYMFAKSIVIKSPTGKTNGFAYNSTQAKIMRVFDKTDNIITFDDLTVGDSVTVVEKIDLLRQISDNRLEIAIKKM